VTRLDLARRAIQAASALALALMLSAMSPPSAHAREAAPASDDPALEARVMDLSSELRCLVCQNETIAASHADLAVDLRNQVREMLRGGATEAEVRDYMTARYGDFVLYRPPLKSTTALLWFGPALLLVGGLGTLWWILRSRSRLAPERFEAEPDPADDPNASPKNPPVA
jgi:cytochrome c-type biogenesis protein CcmH